MSIHVPLPSPFPPPPDDEVERLRAELATLRPHIDKLRAVFGNPRLTDAETMSRAYYVVRTALADDEDTA